jgi:ABC-2 type transport system ATP-binding protein
MARNPWWRRLLPRIRWTRRRLISAAVAVVLLGGIVGLVAWPDRASYRTEEHRIEVRTGPAGDQPVILDATFYVPRSASASARVPAILLAHGFGGTKNSVANDARDLADLGYAVLAWTAQGFGRSTGEIHLSSPDWEVRDAQRLLDWLAARPEVRLDSGGDPRVGVVGGSYGGALALMLAGLDQRVDAIVPMITWNDLARAFLPEATGKDPADGVFKKQWAGLFFGSGSGGLAGGDLGTLLGARDGGGITFTGDPRCGRFAADVCAAYLAVATTGRPTPESLALLRRSSPASIVDRIKAPTLLIQGEADSLFPLSEGDANARAIAATGTPVRVAWFTGGHDGGTGPGTDRDRLNFLTAQWFAHYLKGEGAQPSRSFTYSRITGIDATNRDLVASGYSVTDYPGLSSAGARVTVTGPPQPIANPPNGTPAAVSTLPGGLSSFVGGAGLDVPGQFARFVGARFESTVDVVGAPTVRIRAASPTGEAVLFVKLYAVGADGTGSLPGGQVAPVRLTGLPTDLRDAQPVTVTLPAIVHRFEAGQRLDIVVSTSDQAYATPPDPAVYQVAVDGEVALPTVDGTPIRSPNIVWYLGFAGLLLAVVLGVGAVIVVARVRRKRTHHVVVHEYADTPLVVRGLRKEYADGFVAVSSADFTVQRGQVVGLLGPNGAGKTTSLRVLMGLTRATAGEVLIFGHRLAPGAPVLSRLGALVEGPGFLPHLSGRANLELFWRSTGRPAADARMDEALSIAGLGGAIDRRVKTYSHGMKQRLAIAQAMLGLPEVLVLDEPTDGLDPPQIAEMRRVLRRYATDGRAVLVSSHLLAEVEQTCTDVVVMHKGEVVASGPVSEIVGDSPTVQFDVSDVDTATAVLDRLGGVRVNDHAATADGGGLVVDVNGTPRSEVVAALVNAGVGVDRVVPRRRLEDAFLALVGGDTKAGGER